jgi:hypothetical protein
MSSAGGKKNAAVMKNGVTMMRFVVVKRNGDRLTKNASVLRSAEDLMSVVASTMSANVKRPASRSELRVSMLWLRELARRMICVLEIDGLTAPR